MSQKEIEDFLEFLRDWQDCDEIDMLSIQTLKETFKKSADIIEDLLQK